MVNQIPGQTITQTAGFTTINLSTYGSDPDAGDSITWSYSGNTNITVSLASNIATLTYPVTWTGTENIAFKATDTHGANTSSTAAFTVNGCAQYFAQYFNNKTLSGSPALSRCETEVNNDWGGGSPHASVSADNFSVRWIKNLDVQTAGVYGFSTTSDDGVRLYVDNSAVIDNWTDHGPTVNTANTTLSVGIHVVRMEFYESGGGAVAKLSISAPCTPGTNTFCVEYYNNTSLSGALAYSTTESTINHDWGNGGPGNGVNNDSFSGRWQGNFNFTAGNHTFTTTSDDGVRLYVDGNLVINNWTDHGTTNNSVTLNLSEGAHLVKMEYYENGGGAVAKLTMT